MLFDNPVEKIEEIVGVMAETGTKPEFECFDTGIVRSVAMFAEVGMVVRPQVNLVMGVASGMPADPDLLPVVLKYLPDGSPWQATVIGRAEVWALHRRAAELGGQLRTGLEDTFYLPDGARAAGNGALVEALARLARERGARWPRRMRRGRSGGWGERAPRPRRGGSARGGRCPPRRFTPPTGIFRAQR